MTAPFVDFVKATRRLSIEEIQREINDCADEAGVDPAIAARLAAAIAAACRAA